MLSTGGDRAAFFTVKTQASFPFLLLISQTVVLAKTHDDTSGKSRLAQAIRVTQEHKHLSENLLLIIPGSPASWEACCVQGLSYICGSLAPCKFQAKV